MGRKTPAVIVAARQRNPQLEKMLNPNNINSRTPIKDIDVQKESTLLHIAVEQRNDALLDLVLHHGIDVNLQNSRGNTALMQALCASSTTPEPIVERLITVPTANLDLRNKVWSSWTALCSFSVLCCCFQ